MSMLVFNNADYVRNAERLLGGHEESQWPFKSSYTKTANPVRPGHVAVLRNGALEIADAGVDGGAFLGLFYSEFNADVDETDGNTIPPTVITGPATVKVLFASLDSGSTYALSASAVVELVAVSGKLVPRPTSGAGQYSPTVAHLQEVLPDGIVVKLLQPSAVGAATPSAATAV